MKKVNPLDPIVNKFAELGYSDIEDVFDMLDDNGDGVLTIKEIKDGMAFHKIELTEEQWTEFLNIIDANCDGVLSLEEWKEILEPRVAEQSGFMKLIGNVNVKDPLELEERILDLQFRNRRLEGELKVLRQQHKNNNKNAKKEEIKKMKS